MSIALAPALRTLGICAAIGAITTLLNTTAPLFYDADGFDAAMALINHPVYAFRQWVLLVHPAFTLMLALGLALALAQRAPGRAAAGLAFAGVEKMTEFVLGVLILFVVNAVWKTEYLAGTGPTPPEDLRVRIEVFYELLSGMFILLWTMFILSTGLFAAALDGSDRLDAGVMLTAAITILLTVFMILGRFAGQEVWTGPIIAWAYGPALTLHRLLIAVWLLRESRRLTLKV